MELTMLTDAVDNAALSLFNAIKYIYMISDEDFYNVNIKDMFRVTLNDVTNPDALESLGLRLVPDKIKELDKPRFDELLKIIRYAFAVRLPFIKRKCTNGNEPDAQVFKTLYSAVCDRGIANPDELIALDFRTSMKLAKSRKEEPFFEADWLRKWVYAYGGELSQFTNRNLFLFGCVEALFPLFYEAFTDKMAVLLTQ